MTLYALVSDAGEILDRRDFTGDAPRLAPAKDKRWLLDIPPAVDSWQVATVMLPIAADAAVVGYSVSDRPLAELQTSKVAAIKAEALDRIRTVFDVPLDGLVWRELNLTARAAELGKLRQEREWTADEQAEWDAGQALWDQVKTIRDASNAAEADVMALTTAEAVYQFDVTGW